MSSRLAYLCSSESWGGLEMNHLRNAQWMQLRGHTVFVFCVMNSRIHKEAESWNLPVVIIPKHKKYYDFKNGRKLVKILKNVGVTHLIIRSNKDMSIAAYAKSQLKEKLHTSYFMEMQIGVKKTNPLHNSRYRKIDFWSCPLPWLVRQVEHLTNFNNELALIPSGMDLQQFENLPSKTEARDQLEIPENALIFGLLGRFDLQKGQVLLLEAMRIAKNHNFHLVLLGEPTLGEGSDYFDEMKRLINENNLEYRVHIRPFMKNPEVFYKAIDWFVMATKKETFGMVTIESLACGTPVLGSDAGGTPEILENQSGGLLFESLNATDLADKIDRIIDQKINYDPDILKEIVLKYDHNLVCEQVEKHLKLIRNND